MNQRPSARCLLLCAVISVVVMCATYLQTDLRSDRAASSAVPLPRARNETHNLISKRHREGSRAWGFIDRVYVITGSWSRYRLQPTLDELYGVGIPDSMISLWHGERDATNGHRGAWRAHAGVAHHALQRSYRRILVFEDDVEFVAGTERGPLTKQLARMTAQDAPAWDFFLLVHNAFGMQRVIDWDCSCTDITCRGNISAVRKDIARVHSWGLLAYMSSESGMRIMANAVHPHAFGQTIDGITFQSQRTFALHPMIVQHRAGRSYTVNGDRPLDLMDEWRARENVLYHKSLECCSENVSREASFVNGSAHCGFDRLEGVNSIRPFN